MNRIRFYVAEVVATGFDFACALTGHAFGCWRSWGARWRNWALAELERQRAEGHAAWLARMTPEDRAEYEAEQRAPAHSWTYAPPATPVTTWTVTGATVTGTYTR